jgi:plastocyanin
MRIRLASLPAVMALALFAPTPIVVGQKGKAFSQAELRVKIGEKFVFKNDDDVTHNVFSAAPGFAFNVVAMKPGAEHELSFTRAGAFDVRCAFHPQMKIKIIVAP